ncbi:TPA: DUF2778 domain-containing protein [Vibrio parahaemolyticus]|nr:DUF2778 domain-containing protein [Vibrio parahaemolyticus]
MESLVYTGTELKWHGRGTFKATSGMAGYQYPEDQCVPDKGPVPEGKYYIPLILGALAEDDGSGFCVLKPSWQVQEIPRGESAGECDPYWANWGYNRVRFEPYDEVTKKRCRPSRSGFYLHDSTKGYSHGCIEVEGRFFNELRAFIKKTDDRKLMLSIKYQPNVKTNGGTYVG